MKIYKFIILLCILQNAVYAQTSKINSTYVWDMIEYLTISKDSFKLYLYSTEPILYGLNKGDSILSVGKVQYESDNFMKLTSKDYEWETKKNMTVIESVDSCLKNSVRFNFIFPFDGKYKIMLYIGNSYKNIFEFKDKKEFIMPCNKDSILTFSFTILNQTPVKFPYRNYLKAIKFNSFKYTAKNNNSNSLDIFIPDLTNSYFSRYYIDGEYIKVVKNDDVDYLIWHNMKYEKLFYHQ